MAVVELVKNAYDADARNVTVGVNHTFDPKRAAISVVDDGDGMHLHTVLTNWLEPATNQKRRGGRKRRTALGRYPLGEKGVGRFAADKLGDRMILVTRARGASSEIALSVAWDHFGDTGYLDEIEIEWQERQPRVFRKHPHGTRIEASALRGEWDRERLTRLREGLSRLVAPSSANRDFRIILRCPEHPELDGEVANALVSAAPYRLAGEIDAEGFLRETDSPADLIDLRPHAGDRFTLETGWRPPQCGPLRVAFYAWDLDVLGMAGAGLDRKTRAQLRRISGVSLYRDGFRVWPYGSPGSDWLELNQRRVNNPTMRLSTNQLVGVVEITQEANPNLNDRTSREGLIDNRAVQDLRALLIASLSILEDRRFAVRQDVAPNVHQHEEKDPVLRLLGELRGHSGAAPGNPNLVNQVVAEYRRQSDQRQATIGRLMRLAGTSISVEQVVAEVRRTIGATATGLDVAKALVEKPDIPVEIRTLIRRIDDQMAFIGRQLDLVGDLAEWDGEFNPPLTDLRSMFRDVETIFAFRLRSEKIRCDLEQVRSVSSSMPRRDLLQVLVHLFENAIYWVCCPSDHPREIRVRLTHNPVGFILADSGPGIAGEVKDRVFDLHYSRRADGRGLGLYLARTILEAHGGSIAVLPDRVLLSGANIRVELPGKANPR
jgi:signal transduction histidine kinase